MNTYFSKVIKAGERQREFNFRQLTGGTEMKYHVDVPDDKGNRIIFQMSRANDGSFKAPETVEPRWILAAEEPLSNAILEQLQMLSKK